LIGGKRKKREMRRRRGRRRRTGKEMQAIAEGHSQEANPRAASETPHISNDLSTCTCTRRCAGIKQAVKDGAGLPEIQPKGLAEMSVNFIEREEDRLEDAPKKRECMDVAGDTTRDSPEDWFFRGGGGRLRARLGGPLSKDKRKTTEKKEGVRQEGRGILIRTLPGLAGRSSQKSLRAARTLMARNTAQTKRCGCTKYP